MSLASTLKALSDSLRRDILIMLKEEHKLTAGEIAEKLDISPQSLSYHLKMLKNSELVLETKEKNFIYYELNATLFDELLLWLKQF